MARQKGKRRHAAAWRTLGLGILVIAALVALNKLHPAAIELAELKVSDLRMYSWPGPAPLGVVAIAAIDDQSIAELGHWPWPRSLMAQLVGALKDYKVKVVVFDLIFSETDARDNDRAALVKRLKSAKVPAKALRSAFGPGNDQLFADALRAQRAAILGFPFEGHRLKPGAIALPSAGYVREIRNPPPLAYGIVLKAPGPPPPVLEASAYLPPIPVLAGAAEGQAHVDIDSDADGVMRTVPTVIRFRDRYCVPLFLATASLWRDNAPLALSLSGEGVLRVTLGEEQIPVDEMGRVMVDFRGPAQTFPYYSVSDIIAHHLPAGALAGKIVLVGVTGHGLGDRVVTPVGADYPAVEIHANAIDNVLRGTFVSRSTVTLGEERVAAIVIGLGVTLAVALLSALWSFVLALVLLAGYFLYAQMLLALDGTLIGVVFPLLTGVLTYGLLASYRYATEGIEKRRLRRAFEHYLHPDVISSVVDDPAGLRLGGERRHLSILFADIVNFTARAERSEPEALVALLNTYMTGMINLILTSQGVVDKLMGDGIMAFWGAPLEIGNPARAAIDCALRMIEELAQLRQRDARFADLDIGIGIATGDVIVGNFGGEEHFDYSVIGDTVNLASRLEGLTRRFGVHLIVTRKTLEEAGGDYLVREIGLVKVKGKEELVAVAEVVAARSGDGGDPRFCARYAEALELIRGGSPVRAGEELRALLAAQPGDRLIALLLDKLAGGSVDASGEIVFEFDSK